MTARLRTLTVRDLVVDFCVDYAAAARFGIVPTDSASLAAALVEYTRAAGISDTDLLKNIDAHVAPAVRAALATAT